MCEDTKGKLVINGKNMKFPIGLDYAWQIFVLYAMAVHVEIFLNEA